MSATFMLLVGGAAFALLGFGRLVHSRVLRHLGGALAFLGVAAVAQWVVLATKVGGRWELWSDVAALLALGYLLARLVLLVVFEWLLAQRMHVVVPRLARDVMALLLYVLVVATVLRYGLNMNVGGLLRHCSRHGRARFALQETLGACSRASPWRGSSGSKPAPGSKWTASSARWKSSAGARWCCAPAWGSRS
jgi:hypothetical protein